MRVSCKPANTSRTPSREKGNSLRMATIFSPKIKASRTKIHTYYKIGAGGSGTETIVSSQAPSPMAHWDAPQEK